MARRLIVVAVLCMDVFSHGFQVQLPQSKRTQLPSRHRKQQQPKSVGWFRLYAKKKNKKEEEPSPSSFWFASRATDTTTDSKKKSTRATSKDVSKKNARLTSKDGDKKEEEASSSLEEGATAAAATGTTVAAARTATTMATTGGLAATTATGTATSTATTSAAGVAATTSAAATTGSTTTAAGTVAAARTATTVATGVAATTSATTGSTTTAAGTAAAARAATTVATGVAATTSATTGSTTTAAGTGAAVRAATTVATGVAATTSATTGSTTTAAGTAAAARTATSFASGVATTTAAATVSKTTTSTIGSVAAARTATTLASGVAATTAATTGSTTSATTATSIAAARTATAVTSNVAATTAAVTAGSAGISSTAVKGSTISLARTGIGAAATTRMAAITGGSVAAVTDAALDGAGGIGVAIDAVTTAGTVDTAATSSAALSEAVSGVGDALAGAGGEMIGDATTLVGDAVVDGLSSVGSAIADAAIGLATDAAVGSGTLWGVWDGIQRILPSWLFSGGAIVLGGEIAFAAFVFFLALSETDETEKSEIQEATMQDQPITDIMTMESPIDINDTEAASDSAISDILAEADAALKAAKDKIVDNQPMMTNLVESPISTSSVDDSTKQKDIFASASVNEKSDLANRINDVDISDVLAEAEDALKIAKKGIGDNKPIVAEQATLPISTNSEDDSMQENVIVASASSDGNLNTAEKLNDFDISDVLAEAEDALKAAEEALGDKQSVTTEMADSPINSNSINNSTNIKDGAALDCVKGTPGISNDFSMDDAVMALNIVEEASRSDHLMNTEMGESLTPVDLGNGNLQQIEVFAPKSSSKKQSRDVDTTYDFDISDVLAEAEMALKTAEKALENNQPMTVELIESQKISIQNNETSKQ